MILILSEQTDATTDIVCSWLNHYGCNYLRINEEDAHNPNVEIRIKNGKFKVVSLTRTSVSCSEDIGVK